MSTSSFLTHEQLLSTLGAERFMHAALNALNDESDPGHASERIYLLQKNAPDEPETI